MTRDKIMRLLIIPFLFLACTSAITKSNVNVIHPVDEFSVKQDTFNIDIKGKMTHAIKYRKKYYVLFKEIVVNYYGGNDKRWLCIFSKGEVEKKVDLPKGLEVTYLDFFVSNDSIFLKPYMNDSIYYLDTQNYTWKKINKADDLIFEDKKYWVYSLNFGEWGGKTWFKDKVTGLEYELESTTPLVNKVDTNYYLTNTFRILKIENPLLLNKCDDEVTYENIVASKKYYEWYGNPVGYQIVYRDITFNSYDSSYKPSIVSSFVLWKELWHLYETDTATFIAKIENNSVKPIQKIAKNLRFFNWSDSYRCRNLNGNNELLKFETKDEKSTGIVDIVDDRILIHYFANRAEIYPKSFGNSKANNIFVQHLNFILSGLQTLQLNKVEQEEKKRESYENTPDHFVGIGDSWNPKKYTIDVYKSFLIQEDSLISYTTEYFATKEYNLVRAVIFEWNETSRLKSQFKVTGKETFTKKLSFLEDCITQKAGKPIKDKKDKIDTEKIWKTSDGLMIELKNMNSFNNIRLVIFQK